MSEFWIEEDLLGSGGVPIDAYDGVQTVRALESALTIWGLLSRSVTR